MLLGGCSTGPREICGTMRMRTGQGLGAPLHPSLSITANKSSACRCSMLMSQLTASEESPWPSKSMPQHW